MTAWAHGPSVRKLFVEPDMCKSRRCGHTGSAKLRRSVPTVPCQPWPTAWHLRSTVVYIWAPQIRNLPKVPALRRGTKKPRGRRGRVCVFYCDPHRNSAVSPRVKLEPVSSRSRSSQEREATARVDAGAVAPMAHRMTAPAFTPVAGAGFHSS